MKKIVKKGIEDLPLVYQLADVLEIKSKKNDEIAKEVIPNRVMKLEKYEADITQAYRSAKPISKIV